MVYSYDRGIKADHSNRLLLIIAAVITAISITIAAFSLTFAAGNQQSGATVGDCISDGVYGNEPNTTNGTSGGPAEQQPGSKGGNVVATQSPGPYTNNPNDPDNPTKGNSVGDYNKLFGGGAVPAACRAATQ